MPPSNGHPEECKYGKVENQYSSIGAGSARDWEGGCAGIVGQDVNEWEMLGRHRRREFY